MVKKLYNTQIEDSILGALLIDPSSFAQIAGKISSNDFYWNKNRAIYEAIESVLQSGGKVDYMTVYDWCNRNNRDVTAFEIADKTKTICTSAHIEEHADILVDFAQRRKLATACEVVMQTLDNDEVTNSINLLSKSIDEVLEALSRESRVHQFRDSILKSREQMYQRIQNYQVGICSTGITTGLNALNSLIGGFKNGELVILAGRPSMGKTAVMLHFALSAAKSGHKVLIFSLEMDDIALANRTILASTQISSARFNEGSMNDIEMLEVEDQLTDLTMLPITVDDSSVQSLVQIESMAKLAKRRNECDIIFIDYMGLIDHQRRTGNREQEVAEVSRKMKALARRLNVPVVLLSQLSRECEKRADKVPILADLRESGAIEQDADKVIFIFRPSYYQMTNSMGDIIPDDCGELIVAKNRNGKIGNVKFRHNESITRITDYE